MNYSLQTLNNSHLNAIENYYSKTKILDKEIEALKEKRDKLIYPHFNNYLESLGKLLLPKFKGGVSYEVMGPFGLGNETSLYVRDKKNKTLGGITFASNGENGYDIKDYGKKHNNTHGRVFYQSMPITEKMTIDWLVKFMKKGFNK